MSRRFNLSVLASLLWLISFFCLAPFSANPPIGSAAAATEVQEPASPSSQPRSLVIGTYNVHICVGNDGRLDFDRIAQALDVEGLDFVGLQEVDRRTQRTQKTDQLAELLKRTQMAGRFGKSIDFQGGEYGIAFLTTGEILEYRHQKYPPFGEKEPRSLQLAKIRAKNGLEFWVLNSHLSLDAEERKLQVQAMLDITRDLAGPVLLLGDFNEKPDGNLYESFQKNHVEKPADRADVSLVEPDSEEKLVPHHGETFSSAKPDRQIDYIWVRNDSGLTIDRTWVRRTEASDHLPVFSKILVETSLEKK